MWHRAYSSRISRRACRRGGILLVVTAMCIQWFTRPSVHLSRGMRAASGRRHFLSFSIAMLRYFVGLNALRFSISYSLALHQYHCFPSNPASLSSFRDLFLSADVFDDGFVPAVDSRMLQSQFSLQLSFDIVENTHSIIKGTELLCCLYFLKRRRGCCFLLPFFTWHRCQWEDSAAEEKQWLWRWTFWSPWKSEWWEQAKRSVSASPREKHVRL